MTDRLDNLVVGLGASGLSMARHLARQGLGFAVADSRAAPPNTEALRALAPRAALHAGPFDTALFARARRLLLSPGVSPDEPAVAAARATGAELLGDIELFACAARAPVAAVTGTNGKSTVTTLLGEMARAAGVDVRVGGNLGTPALDLLGETEPALYVLELSSFQLEVTHSLRPAAATVLNLTPDHYDRHPEMAAYAAAKARIFEGDGVQVLNAEDPAVMALVRPGRRVLRFGVQPPAGAQEYGLLRREGGDWLARGDEPLLPLAALRIQGAHNAANALAAMALADALGIARAAQLAVLREFAGLPHRMQWVASLGGVDWYNDSKGTNVGATVAATGSLPGRFVLIAGGVGKGQDFAPLRAALAGRARAVVLIGEDGPKIGAALGVTVPQVTAASMVEAVRAARQVARPGDFVLLSPACASFDWYANYKARGEDFSRCVLALSAQGLPERAEKDEQAGGA